MNNYHNKQKDNKSNKSSIKRFNALLEYDQNINSAYFYIPPSSSKAPVKVKYSEEIKTKTNTFVVDYDGNNHIIGFEILNGESLDLKGLNINE